VVAKVTPDARPVSPRRAPLALEAGRRRDTGRELTHLRRDVTARRRGAIGAVPVRYATMVRRPVAQRRSVGHVVILAVHAAGVLAIMIALVWVALQDGGR
jgi:hypothetical protein